MTATVGTNIAQGDAHVDLQAGVIHGDVTFYQLPPDPTPEQKFGAAVKYLRARARDKARSLIEDAVAGGHVNTKVQFHRLVALLSGRTLQQLSSDEWDCFIAIHDNLGHLDDRDEWAAGLKVIKRLVVPVSSTETDLVIKEIDALNRPQREWIYGHLAALLEGTVQDEVWQESVALARSQRTDSDRFNRVWKFFHPTPAQPRVLQVQPAAVPFRNWAIAVIGAVLFAIALGKLTVLATAHGGIGLILALIVGLNGLAASFLGAADRHYRTARRRAKDAELIPPRQRRPETPAGGFAHTIDRYFDRYFRRYVPRGTDRRYWLAQTAGIRQRLRDEVVEIYRETRVDADRVAWLVRHLVGDVRDRWERDTLTAYRHQLRIPARTTALHVGGLILLAGAGYWFVPAVLLADPLPGTACLLLAVVAVVPTVRSSIRIIAEYRRVADDQAERHAEQTARWRAYHRWQAKLSDKPSDLEMASWLEADRKVLVDHAMQQYKLRPHQVIAHAFIEAPASPCKKARYPDGPWRYSRYRLLLFLLTEDGVRQVTIDLDFETAETRSTQRLNYRFDAVAAVRINGVAAERQTFEMMLVNGETISVQVSEPQTAADQNNEDPTKVTELSLDASGLPNTLHVLEGIAAECKEWVRHRRRRTDERLASLVNTLREATD